MQTLAEACLSYAQCDDYHITADLLTRAGKRLIELEAECDRLTSNSKGQKGMKPNRENKSTSLMDKHYLIGHCLLHPNTSKGDAAVLWYLIERYNDEIGAAEPPVGSAWPMPSDLPSSRTGLGNIATNTELDRRTVQRSITRLVAENYLTVERGGRAYKGAPGKSNRYHPNFALGAQLFEAHTTFKL